MTRKEKKESARKWRSDQKWELLGKLKAQYEKTKNFRESIEALDSEIQRRVNREPQKSSEFRQIFKELSQSLLDGIERAKAKSGD